MFKRRKTNSATKTEYPQREAIVYTRIGCHLCEDAQEILQRYGLSPRMIDIDGDPDLQSRFTACVPVVVIDGRETFRGRVNEVLLRRILSHRDS